jgi:hypothetical protein
MACFHNEAGIQEIDLRDEGYISNPMRPLFNDPSRVGYLQAVVRLIGHAAGTTVVFLSLAVLAWLLSWGVAALHAIHPFSTAILAALHGVELAILYIDIGLSGIVIAVSAYRFIKDITGAGL